MLICTFSVNYIFLIVILSFFFFFTNREMDMKYPYEVYIYSIVNGIMKVVEYKEEMYMCLEQLFVILFIGFPLFLQIMGQRIDITNLIYSYLN